MGKKEIKGIFDRMLKAYGFEEFIELSVHFGKKENWAANARNRGTFPYEAVVRTSEDTGVSLDHLVYGDGEIESDEQKAFKFKEQMLDFLFPLFNEDDAMPDLTAKQAVKVANALVEKFGGIK